MSNKKIAANKLVNNCRHIETQQTQIYLKSGKLMNLGSRYIQVSDNIQKLLETQSITQFNNNNL